MDTWVCYVLTLDSVKPKTDEFYIMKHLRKVTSEFVIAVAAERGERWQILRMSRLGCQNLDTENDNEKSHLFFALPNGVFHFFILDWLGCMNILLLYCILTLSIPVMRICVNFSTVYNDTLCCSFGLWLEALWSHYTCPDGFALASIPTAHYIDTVYDHV